MAKSSKNPKSTPAAGSGSLATGLVTRSHGRHYFVTDDQGRVYEAHRRGKKADVVVGDLVRFTPPQGDVVAIEAVEPRKNLIFRSDLWRVKAIAGNLTLVAVVIASRPSFNPRFVWKALIAAHTAGVSVCLIRNKSDLADKKEEIESFCERLRQTDPAVRTVDVSAECNPEDTLRELSPIFAGQTVLLVGQSGMGKSTLLNVLCPGAQARTREYSQALDIGKQTTTHTALYEVSLLGQPTRIIDSPGFQEFGLAHVGVDDILRAMPDIASCVDGCRFYNCTHTTEPGCSVIAAVKAGRIDAGRWAFYKELVGSVKAASSPSAAAALPQRPLP